VNEPIPPVILVKFTAAKVVDPATERALLQFTFPFKVLVLETDSTPWQAIPPAVVRPCTLG
jgi:hypothetical protein